MSQNIETVNTYLDGFRKNDHEQILSCLTDDIEWTVFGAFRLTGKEAYDKAIDGAPSSLTSRPGGRAHGRAGPPSSSQARHCSAVVVLLECDHPGAALGDLPVAHDETTTTRQPPSSTGGSSTTRRPWPRSTTRSTAPSQSWTAASRPRSSR